MHFSHQVSITGPLGAPPETAAIRFVAMLPAGWYAEVAECGESSARLLVAVPAGTTTAQSVGTAVGILSRPGLRNWHLASFDRIDGTDSGNSDNRDAGRVAPPAQVEGVRHDMGPT